MNKKTLKVIKCNSNMECQFCSQPIQVPKLTLISNTVTCHNVILKITDGKCLRVITITLWFQEEIRNEIRKAVPANLQATLIDAFDQDHGMIIGEGTKAGIF